MIKLKHKLIVSTFFVLVINFISLSCTAQSEWDSIEVKAKDIVFMVFSRKDSPRLLIQNINHGLKHNGRMIYDPENLGYSSVSLIDYNTFLNAFKEAFSDKKIEELAEKNEKMYMSMFFDEKAQIYDITYYLNKKTTISLGEIEKLEKEFLSKVKFEVVGRKVENKYCYHYLFLIYFKGVKEGEIRVARMFAKLKDEYKKRYEND